MRKILKSLAVAVAILLAMTLSFAVLADNESTADESAVVESSEVSTEASTEASADASDDASAETSAETSKEETSKEDTSKEDTSKAETSKDETSSTTTDKNTTTPTVEESDFPWARVITLIVIVVLVILAVILSKTQTKLGLRIAKFFKEYWSEIKKVSWCSPKDTAKATGIVLVVVIVAAIAIGLLDLGFAKIVELLANLFN